MKNVRDLKPVWADLATLIEKLPPDERTRYQDAFRLFAHDLRQSIGITYGAESLLRRSVPAIQENLELLDSIHSANQRAIRLVTDFARPFDDEITLPFEEVHQQ